MKEASRGPGLCATVTSISGDGSPGVGGGDRCYGCGTTMVEVRDAAGGRCGFVVSR